MLDREDALLHAEARALWEARGRPADRDLDIWLEAEARLLPTLPLGPVVWSRFAAERTQLLARHGRRDLCLWDVGEPPTLRARFRSDDWRDAAVGRGGVVIVGVEPTSGLVVRDARDGRVLAAASFPVRTGYRQDIHDVLLSEDGRRAAAATRDVWTDAYDPSWSDRLTIVDTVTGQASTLRDRSGPPPGIHRIALAPDGGTLALLGLTWAKGQHVVFVLDAASGVPRWHAMLAAASGSGRCRLLLSGDGGTLVVVDATRLTRWDARTGAARETHPLEEPLTLAALSPAGGMLAGAVGKKIWTWRLDTGAPMLRQEFPVPPAALAFDADGGHLLVAAPGPDPTVPRVTFLAVPQA